MGGNERGENYANSCNAFFTTINNSIPNARCLLQVPCARCSCAASAAGAPDGGDNAGQLIDGLAVFAPAVVLLQLRHHPLLLEVLRLPFGCHESFTSALDLGRWLYTYASRAHADQTLQRDRVAICFQLRTKHNAAHTALLSILGSIPALKALKSLGSRTEPIKLQQHLSELPSAPCASQP